MSPRSTVEKSKAIPKKKTPAIKTIQQRMDELKYSDKSAGQEHLLPIFDELCKLLRPYNKGELKLSGGKDGKLLLGSGKKYRVDGEEKNELWFAGALVQKGYVGFYYTAAHSEPDVRAIFSEASLKLLKGRSCFHIKKFDKETFEEIRKALKAGYEKYLKKGWL